MYKLHVFILVIIYANWTILCNEAIQSSDFESCIIDVLEELSPF